MVEQHGSGVRHCVGGVCDGVFVGVWVVGCVGWWGGVGVWGGEGGGVGDCGGGGVDGSVCVSFLESVCVVCACVRVPWCKLNWRLEEVLELQSSATLHLLFHSCSSPTPPHTTLFPAVSAP